jgi:hypothetical protein
MANTFDFTPFDRQLLKLAAESASAVAKTAKKAAQKAYLTEAESEAHAMEGYADEAIRFLNNPEGIVDESATDDATEEERKEAVQLMFGHRAALRVGCLILIKDAEALIEQQTEIFADADGTHARVKDFRRLESRLRGMNSDQTELPLPIKDPEAEDAEPQTDEAPAEDAGPSGPFDAPPVSPPLALSAGTPVSAEIPEAEFEILEDGDDDEEDDAQTVSAPMSSDDVDAWLNEPLRAAPDDASDDADETDSPE